MFTNERQQTTYTLSTAHHHGPWSLSPWAKKRLRTSYYHHYSCNDTTVGSKENLLQVERTPSSKLTPAKATRKGRQILPSRVEFDIWGKIIGFEFGSSRMEPTSEHTLVYTNDILADGETGWIELSWLLILKHWTLFHPTFYQRSIAIKMLKGLTTCVAWCLVGTR